MLACLGHDLAPLVREVRKERMKRLGIGRDAESEIYLLVWQTHVLHNQRLTNLGVALRADHVSHRFIEHVYLRRCKRKVISENERS